MLLGNRYEIGRLLGRGGMAEVYLARDLRLNRTVAVKVLRSDLARDEHFQERFRREAQAAAGLNHPAIVGVHDTGEDRRTELTGEQVTIPFIVMEYVEGETLRGSISEENPMSATRAAEIMSGVLAALEYSHRAGIVHRDIKPGNIMITDRGEVKVMDFGIARAVAESTAAMTQTQAVMGTAQYLSPEQARGQQVDARSDVYAAAVVLYELLTGRPPFTGDSPVSIAYQHVREAAPAPSTFNPHVSEYMDAVVLKGLAKDREHRYQDAASFASDINDAAAGRMPRGLGAFAAGLGAHEAATSVMGASDYPTEVMQDQSTQLIPAQTASMAPAAATAVASPEASEMEEEGRDKGKILVWVLAVLALLALAATAWWFLSARGDSGQQVAVPNVVGVTQEQAREQLAAVNLTPKFTQEASADVEQGTVISTDPPAQTLVMEGSTVNVVVSAGPNAVQVPSLIGLTEDEARKAVEDLGLTLTVAGTEDSADVEADKVARVDPTEGTQVSEGDEIRVWLSSGRIEVPRVVGLSEAAAIEALEAAGLQHRVSYNIDENQTVGTVLEQTPAAADKVVRGTVIDLVVNTEPGPERVPNLTGRTQEEAEQVLGAAGFGYRTEYQYSDSVPGGRVISTDPAANAEVESGATIRLIISNGPEPGSDPDRGEDGPPNGPSEPPGDGRD